jgi:serine phosphatase RsbU (regulator of sigma subunit)
MSRRPPSAWRARLRRETQEARTAFRDVLADVRTSWNHSRTFGERLNTPPVIAPARLKRLLIAAIKIFIAVELVAALLQGLWQHNWSRLGWDLLIAGILYSLWDRIARVTAEKKEIYRRRIESAGERIRLWDALVFSLLWSDEIYQDIPADRRHLVAISYTLILFGLIAAFTRFGEGLMTLIVAGSLVLAAVNLLAWVASRERTARESLQTELRLAREVQLALMPGHAPVLEGFDIAGLSVPASEVGGDHFDFLPPGEDTDRLSVTVFDVSGKGMQAAMSAVFTSGAFVSEVRASTSPAEILTRLNAAIYRYSTRGHFVAFCCGMLDRRARTFTFANAGQPKPLLWRGGKGNLLDAAGVPFALGMTADSVYADRTLALETGDVILLLSDGMTEAMNAADEPLGVERLEAMAGDRISAQPAARELVDGLLQDVQRYAGGRPQHDDMTVVAVRVL